MTWQWEWLLCSICENEELKTSGQFWMNAEQTVWLCSPCSHKHRTSTPREVFNEVNANAE